MEMRYVEWIDSIGSNGWEPMNETRKMRPLQIRTTGFVLDEGDDYVTLIQSFDERPDQPFCDHTICIPRFAITQMQILERETPEQKRMTDFALAGGTTNGDKPA